MDTYHVSPANDGWELKKAGAARASKHSATKQELMGSLATFLEEERTYPRSADPRRTKG